MRFMIIRRADADTEAGVPASTELIADMMAYNEQLVDAGVMLDGMGLHPSSHNAARISFRDGSPTVVDGPFAEAKELIAGFTLIEVRSREEALEWVRRWPEPNVELELREVITGVEHFGDAATPELIAKEQELRDRTGAV